MPPARLSLGASMTGIRNVFLRTLLAATGAALLATNVAALTRADCERDYKPHVGQAGKDVVWVPTPYPVVQGMLSLGKVTSSDVLYDLGAGDGIIAITAGKLGATAVGIEYDPAMARLAKCLVDAEGVGSKVTIVEGDIFKEDFARATVVTMYLLPELNRCIRHRLLAMRPGTRVVSHDFRMGDWDPDDTFQHEFRMAHLWIVPARVEGTWVVRDDAGTSVTVRLTQSFQNIGGEVVAGAPPQTLVGASLNANGIRFAFNDAKGATRTFTGTVSANEMRGLLRNGSANIDATAAAQGPLRAGAWAQMAQGCQRLYGG